MDGRDGKGQEYQEESLIWNLQYCSQVKSSSNFKGGRARLLWGARRRERSGGRGAAQPAWLDSPEPGLYPHQESSYCLAPRMIDGPLSGPKRQKLVGEGPRAHDSRRRRSPDPTDALAHRDSPCAGKRPSAGPRSLPSSAWIGFALPYSRLPEKGTKLVTWGAAMIKKKTMWIKPWLRAIQPCQLRRAAPSRSQLPDLSRRRAPQRRRARPPLKFELGLT